MVTLNAEMEDEFEAELQHELVHESHESHEAHEHENEAEDEQFFNSLASMADRTGRSQALRRIAMAAARAALKGRREPAGIEGEAEAEAQELEMEWDPVRRIYVDAELEHIGHAAAEAATEQEAAEHFLPLIPLAAKFALPLMAKALPFATKAGGALIKKFAPKILGKVAPQLTRGVGNVARMLYRNRSTRPLLHAMPRIARGTVVDLARRVATRRPVNPKIALDLLAKRTAQTLSQPRVLAQSYRNSRIGDSRFHQRARQALGTPVGGGVRAGDDDGGLYGPGAPQANGSLVAVSSSGWNFCPSCGRPM